MNIFNFIPTKNQIKIFEHNVAEILKFDFPKVKEVLEFSSKKISIQFSKKPCGIYLSINNNYENILPELETSFDLYGLKVFNKKRNEYEEITLFFHNNSLTFIEVTNPEKFYKTYDFEKLQIGELRTKYVYTKNQDSKNTLEILKNVSQVQLNQLEIENAIEIEINDNLYYTILDMENGNYIAVDKSTKVYLLNHSHIEKVKEISNNIDSFFDLYKGSKSNLIEVMYEQKTPSFYGNTI